MVGRHGEGGGEECWVGSQEIRGGCSQVLVSIEWQTVVTCQRRTKTSFTLSYFLPVRNYVERHESLLKDVLEGRVEGRVEGTRPRGRPRKGRINWEENVKNWSGLKLQECTITAENRVKWRDVAINLRTGRRNFKYLI